MWTKVDRGRAVAKLALTSWSCKIHCACANMIAHAQCNPVQKASVINHSFERKILLSSFPHQLIGEVPNRAAFPSHCLLQEENSTFLIGNQCCSVLSSNFSFVRGIIPYMCLME